MRPLVVDEQHEGLGGLHGGADHELIRQRQFGDAVLSALERGAILELVCQDCVQGGSRRDPGQRHRCRPVCRNLLGGQRAVRDVNLLAGHVPHADGDAVRGLGLESQVIPHVVRVAFQLHIREVRALRHTDCRKREAGGELLDRQVHALAELDVQVLDVDANADCHPIGQPEGDGRLDSRGPAACSCSRGTDPPRRSASRSSDRTARRRRYPHQGGDLRSGCSRSWERDRCVC